MRTLSAFVSLALIATCVGCAGDAQTTIKLAVTYEPSWGLDNFEMTAGGILDRGRPSETVRVVVPDDWAGMPLMIDLDGLHAGERVAHGTITVTPVLRGEVRETLVLTKLPCGAWCTPGATACMGDGVVVCSQRDEDSCMEWSEPTACDGGTPYCSLGVCGASCVDECVAGETRCAGPDGVQTCGQGDSDSCADWLPAVACTGDDSCSNGACTPLCHDECEPGQTRCEGNGVSVCGDLDANGCLEWSPMTTCAGGQTCSGGACSATCTDECSASTCSGSSFTQCGQFDLDACMDLSPGTSCVPADPCREGECTASGCTDAPLVCDQPPAPMCVDANTLRTYTASGTCSLGTCSYAQTDTTCASGCSAGACNGSCTPSDTPEIVASSGSTLDLSLDDTYVYWTGDGDQSSVDLWRRAKSGGSPEAVASGNYSVHTPFIDDSYAYWVQQVSASASAVMRRSKAGGAVETILQRNEQLVGVAVDSAYVYFGSYSGKVARRLLSGGTIEEWMTSDSAPSVMAVDDTYVYWYGEAGLERMPKAGGTIETIAPDANTAVLDSTHIYWRDGNGISRRTKSGGTIESISTEVAYALAVDGTYVYWSTGGFIDPVYIRRRPKNGGTVQTLVELLPDGFGDRVPQQIAVDATYVYFNEGYTGDGIFRAPLSACP